MSVGINETIVGSCSLCGGAVTAPTYWHSVIQPVPTCKSCGATKAVGPVIPMTPRNPYRGADFVVGDPVEITSTGTDIEMPKKSNVVDVIDPNRKFWW